MSDSIHPLAFKFARYAAQMTSSFIAFVWVSKNEANLVVDLGHLGFMILMIVLCISMVYSLVLAIIVGYNVHRETRDLPDRHGRDGLRL